MKHEREIPHYEGEIDTLATKIGRLTFDQLGTFLGVLTEDLNEQSEADFERNRPKLAAELAEAAHLIEQAKERIDEAWQISESHMTTEERGK